MYPQSVVHRSDLVLFQVSGGWSLDRISPVVKNVLGSANLAGGDRIAARNDTGLSRICFNDAVFESFMGAAGIKGQVLHIADTYDNHSGISV